MTTAGAFESLATQRRARESLPAAGSHLTTGLAAATMVACAVTLAVPDLLQGPDVMNGSVKGTALVALLVAAPLLVVAEVAVRAGSTRGMAVRAGASAYLLYNAVLFVFGTPFNRAFPLYVAMLGLAVWATVGSALALWLRVPRLSEDVPRWVPAFMFAIIGLNAAAWLARVVPALDDEDPVRWLDGTGLTTNPVIAQDLAVWLPLLAWLGWGVAKSNPRLTALAAAGLVFWTVECVGVASDQWWGHVADPGSPWASAGAVPLFLAGAVASLVVTRRLLGALPDLVAPPTPLQADEQADEQADRRTS